MAKIKQIPSVDSFKLSFLSGASPFLFKPHKTIPNKRTLLLIFGLHRHFSNINNRL